MGPLGEKKNYVVSPPYEGHLYDGNTPLANVKIVRKTSYNTIKSSWVEDEFYTDEYGYFNIPAKEAAMELTFLDQFLAITKLLVELESETLLVMESDRMESDGNFIEFGGAKPKDLICNIRNSEEAYREGHSRIYTRCRWSGMPEKAMPLLDQLESDLKGS